MLAVKRKLSAPVSAQARKRAAGNGVGTSAYGGGTRAAAQAAAAGDASAVWDLLEGSNGYGAEEEEFLEEEGGQNGRGKGEAQEKRLDPSDGKGPFTYASFIKFHGEAHGKSLWEQAGRQSKKLGALPKAQNRVQPMMAASDGGLVKSGAVAAFRQAQRTGQNFTAGKGQGKASFAGARAKRAGRTAPAAGVEIQKKFLDQVDIPAKEKKAMKKLRAEQMIEVEGDEDCSFPPIRAFEDLASLVPNYALDALAAQGIQEPMPVQAQGLPLVLSGQDLVATARTGSGKTLAYLLPALVHINAQEALAQWAASPIALILAPTRELAVQIADEATKLVQGSDADEESPHAPGGGIGAAVLYGGHNKDWQVAEVRKHGHIVAATPGRLVDVVESGDVSLERVSYFVLDEADRMLEYGFGDQVGAIASGIRADRQMLFFSATWPQEVQELANQMCYTQEPPMRLSVGQGDSEGPVTRDDIVQEVVVFDQGEWEERDGAKQELLYAHLREVLSVEEHKALVFVSRKNIADELCNVLWKEGFATQAMHGGMSQDRRLAVLEEFRQSQIKLLVTTDVMGRGLDIPDISHVVCYDMGDAEDYVHRIGRTARGPYGQGHALTFFEYDRKWPHIAGELCEILETSGQEVPEELQEIAHQVANGLRDAVWSQKSRWQQGGSAW
eukprot:gnl/TRDRNA2_/TRDRNA2_28248_c0_seq1.p1 gnl/TRDRNA2_/TRDRNA2_28248_c0~~gnl/TRDRNA2_/TRDRNA2_28248_c0_seq1.p1  ORF type:complete len:671 (+),score=159.87 gnl/TRDRNA2_/TRDRNA2_28248_c0_seq1:88-2100(+)